MANNLPHGNHEQNINNKTDLIRRYSIVWYHRIISIDLQTSYAKNSLLSESNSTR